MEAGLSFGQADFAHPIFDPIRPWLARLPRTGWPSREALNALAERAQIKTEAGKPVRFVAPAPLDPYYEVQVHETGCVATRPENWHDLFNALAWLAFPRSKARINAMHAAQIPREGGKRGRLRDMLTLFDEGGAIVACADAGLAQLIRGFRWQELFWQNRGRVLTGLRFIVLGHAVLEKALAPWPGVTCKAICIAPGGDPDARAAQWLAEHAANGTPRDLAPLPVFGYPDWLPENDRAEFYADERYFRPFRRDVPAREK
ncbi:MAG: DUF3025 domain-containing protein [Burkholderiales bacterium]